MHTARQKRQSCEACRTRKLKCSGQKTGCWRCKDLGQVCKFQDKGMPGRPRKWTQIEARQQHRDDPEKQQHRRDGRGTMQDSRSSDQINSHKPESGLRGLSQTPPTLITGESATCSSTDFSPPVPQELTTTCESDYVLGYDDFNTLPALDFNTSLQLSSLPLDFFGACLSNSAHGRAPTELSSNESATSAAPLQSCDCAEEVFRALRALKRGPISHSTISSLRLGIDLFAKLLTCHICYDVSKPPSITLQNVLLIGRLSLELTTGYQKYLKWLKDYCSGLADREEDETVYLAPGEVSTGLGFKISGDNFHEVVIQGLRGDAGRLSDLGRQFATRQHNRHLIGHETCPDSEGRCWREGYDIDPDPSDVCPHSAEAKALTPCYRVVDEVNSKIELFANAVT